MDPSLISLITQKKNVIKSTSIKGSEYIINKSIKTDNDLTCDTLRCNNIDIDPTQPTIITNAEINKSKINSKTNLQKLEEWDSLGILTVMTALDKKFKGSIKMSSFDKVKSASDIQKLLK